MQGSPRDTNIVDTLSNLRLLPDGSCASEVCRGVVIEDYSDEPFTAWDPTSDKGRRSSLLSDFF